LKPSQKVGRKASLKYGNIRDILRKVSQLGI
jgi:hypothetical protein